MKSPSRIALAAFSLSLLLACGGGGGGGSSTPAKTVVDTLSYTNPSSGTYLLVEDTARSTAGHLVLDLIGPSGGVSGVGFFLTADPTKVTWTKVASGDSAMVDSTAFANTIAWSKVNNDTLEAGVFQEGVSAAVTATTGTVLASVALELNSNVPIASAGTVSLTTGKGVILNPPASTTATTAIVISAGTLSAN
jgi:hypothetical protein